MIEATGYNDAGRVVGSREGVPARAVDAMDVLRVAVAIGVLLVGQVDPEPRLVIGGVALNTLLFAAAGVLVVMLPGGGRTLAALVFVLTPLHLFGATAAWSPNAAYGLWKYANLGSAVTLAVALVHPVLRDKSVVVFGRLWVWISLVLLALAVATKLDGGFFNRDVRFFVNGPIVFARIMGVALFLALVAFSGHWRVVLATVFAAAIVWTASKGPILFAALCAVVVLFQASKRPLRVLFFAAAGAAAAVMILAPPLDTIEGSATRLVETFEYVVNDGPMPGSVSSRIDMIVVSLDGIRDNLFGIGAGGWSALTVNAQPWPYPHNLFLEVLAEAGLVIGAVALIPFVMFLAKPTSAFFVVALFLLLCQQTSGDILDARYLLFFSVLAMTSAAQLPGRARGEP